MAPRFHPSWVIGKTIVELALRPSHCTTDPVFVLDDGSRIYTYPQPGLRGVQGVALGYAHPGDAPLPATDPLGGYDITVQDARGQFHTGSLAYVLSRLGARVIESRRRRA